MKVTKGSFWDHLMQDLGMRPKYKTPNPVEDIYGWDNTIHQTGTVDVQLDKSGQVMAVWFRCRMLPFTQSVRDYGDYAPPSPDTLGSIKGVVFEGDVSRS